MNLTANMCNFLHYGDKLIEDNSIDLIHTDPPYGLSKIKPQNKSTSKFTFTSDKGSWDAFETPKHFEDFTEAWLKICYKKLKPNGCILIHGTHHNIFLTYFLCKKLGYVIKGNPLLTWFIPNSSPAENPNIFLPTCEWILWFVKGKNYTFNNTKVAYNPLTRQIRDHFKINKLVTGHPERIKGHPTQKPTELLIPLITTLSNEGDTILDPFLGSGSEMLSCKRTGRSCIGFEMRQECIPLIKQKVGWDVQPLDKKITYKLNTDFSNIVSVPKKEKEEEKAWV